MYNSELRRDQLIVRRDHAHEEAQLAINSHLLLKDLAIILKRRPPSLASCFDAAEIVVSSLFINFKCKHIDKAYQIPHTNEMKTTDIQTNIVTRETRCKGLQAASWEIHRKEILENFITLVFMEYKKVIAAVHTKKLNSNRSELIPPL